MRLLKLALAGLLWTVIVLCLAAAPCCRISSTASTIAARRRAHFDGAHFFNPDGDDDRLCRRTRPHPSDRAADLRRLEPARLAGAMSRCGRRNPRRASRAKRCVVTWIGHATVLVQADGINILTDPVWSDHAGPFGFGPRRVAAPGIALRGSAEDRPHPRQPQSLRPYGPDDAQAAVAARPPDHRHQPRQRQRHRPGGHRRDARSTGGRGARSDAMSA